MSDNWIEREARRKENLGKADELWQEISTAIDNVCKSFNRHCSDQGSARFSPQNGHAILVEVSHVQNKDVRQDAKRRVRIVFDGSSRVVVTLDEHPAREVQIDANLEGCFLKYGNQPLSIDEFSRLALEDALSTPRNPNQIGSPSPRAW